MGFPFPEGFLKKTDTYTGNGIINLFSLTNTCKAGAIQVFLNGVLQEKDVDWILADTLKSFSFAVTPKNTWRIEAKYIKESFRGI